MSSWQVRSTQTIMEQQDVVAAIREATTPVAEVELRIDVARHLDAEYPSLDALLGRAGPSRPDRRLSKKRRALPEELDHWRKQHGASSEEVSL